MTGTEIFIAFGSNEEPHRHLKEGIKQLRNIVTDVKLSSCYRSRSCNGGADYLNMVVSARTQERSYSTLVIQLKEIEKECGRIKNSEHRCALDLDLLLFGDLIIDNVLPHDDLYRYPHVLVPFCELAGEREDLLYHVKYRELMDRRDFVESESLTEIDII